MEKAVNNRVIKNNLISGMSILETIGYIRKGSIFLMDNFFGDNVLTDGISMYTLSDEEYELIKKTL